MMEFVMGPSLAPGLHLLPLRQHLKRVPALCCSQDNRSCEYFIGEENMTCLTNLADSGGCQWVPMHARQWLKHSAEKASDNIVHSNDYGLQELFAEQSEVSLQNDRPQNDWSDECSSGDADGLFSHTVKDNELRQSADCDLNREMAVGYDDSPVMDKRQFLNGENHKDDYNQRPSDHNESNLKPQLEKLGWKIVGRHAESRRKRWAQADPLLDFWKAVSASPYAAPFRRPVALLDDYGTIIHQPMDLSTIRRLLENDESYSFESLRRDLMLMVTNALVYNKKGTETHDMALKLKGHATKLFEKETSYSTLKLLPVGNATKPTVKVAKVKHMPHLAMNLPPGANMLPLAPVKKHRTMRRSRICMSNDGSGFRSDVANGAAVDSSSEEEAAAVLICFRSGKSGDGCQSLSTSFTKLQSPKKRLKRMQVDTDDLSACSDTRSLSGKAENFVYMAGTMASQSKFEKLGLAVNTHASVRIASVRVEENFHGSSKIEKSCMGLKHKWQERWRMQSAACCEDVGTLQQSSEPAASNPCGDKLALEGGSVEDAKFRPLPQILKI